MSYSPRAPNIDFHGRAACHDQACSVYWYRASSHADKKSPQSAIYNLSDGCFHPSWEAQKEGYRLIHIKSKFQERVLRWLGLIS